jgi:hypothetical protein
VAVRTEIIHLVETCAIFAGAANVPADPHLESMAVVGPNWLLLINEFLCRPSADCDLGEVVAEV